MLDLTWLIPALPLAGFLVLVALGRRLGEPLAGWLATAAVGGSFVASVVVFLGLVGEPEESRAFSQVLFEWVPAGGFTVDVGFLADPLSLTMCLFITGIATLIHLYAIGYMHGDPRFSKFFLYLNLFVFSMLMLVLGDNLLITFLGWEGVGACSYFLISFWHESDANASAGKKAFVTNRIGDWGYMVAMFLTFTALGSITYADIIEGAGGLATSTATAITLLLLVGATGKSAQIPLFVWLPDAMAGPTPVSALIHAATMVTSGVYLLTRMSPVIAASSDWVTMVIAVVGALTALVAATIAVGQHDIKKVLAYSTISQLGYMFLAIGSGAYVAAIFHMVTHAFFKALMFLGSGSVIHGLGDEQDMRRMGALRKLLPITAITYLVGWLAIAGVPPFSGFWSKDEILLFAWEKSPVLWAIGLVTALLTAFYMSRQVFLTFFGTPRWDRPLVDAAPELARERGLVPAGAGDDGEVDDADGDEAGSPTVHNVYESGHLPHGVGPKDEIHPHESPWTMTAPLVVLAGLALVGGAIQLPFTDSTKRLEHWLLPVVEAGEHHLTSSTATKWALAAVAIVAGIAGIVGAAALYLRRRYEDQPATPPILLRGWYYDSSISTFMGGPGRKAFDAVAWFDRTVVDGAVNGVATLVRVGGGGLRRTQTGFVRAYAGFLTAGAIFVVFVMILRGALL
ncbi:NADH-quinone oxidoreductase subunit L [Iamia sp. SCSIO 61187]|uniref:NADH-quinone oxidoreductase subunit L n=1 Tax=Iamia sp. SCSIO 61187 TaxID=2722752 RepID=UPI001C62BC4C|nr:NADH-quinone oxidoreductase subunit L [Iamia sp. SCSIO 61187]QYG94808.1 NADH-quinone oxidoreductase subunit L [Iamia sp. SCSIO 61187]